MAERPRRHCGERQIKTRLADCLTTEIGIERTPGLRQIVSVKSTSKRRVKSEAEVVKHATNNLLGALKQEMLKKDGRVDYEKLRKDGYSDRLLAKLEQA